MEAGDALLPIEVKATVNPRLRDTVRLRSFRREYPEQARAGLLLHDGDAVEWLAPDLLCGPLVACGLKIHTASAEHCSAKMASQ